MILIDYSGVAFAASMAACPKPADFNIDLVRHAVLNSIRSASSKFKAYGPIVICCDGPNTWRKEYFPNYKCLRKKNDDIKMYFDAIHLIKREIKENFPYQFVEVVGAEGDDVIAVLAQTSMDQNIIVSNDKDMTQLMEIGAQVYSPGKGEFIVPSRSFVKNKVKIVEEISPAEFLKEHILKGDRGDSIPNINSPDDVFVTGGTQKDVGRAFIDAFDMSNVPAELEANFKRNETLVSLFKIPDNIRTKIMDEYAKPYEANDNMLNYFIANGLKEHASKIQDF